MRKLNVLMAVALMLISSAAFSQLFTGGWNQLAAVPNDDPEANPYANQDTLHAAKLKAFDFASETIDDFWAEVPDEYAVELAAFIPQTSKCATEPKSVASSGASDFTATAKVGWDDDAIYIGVKVVDDDLQTTETIELMFAPYYPNWGPVYTDSSANNTYTGGGLTSTVFWKKQAYGRWHVAGAYKTGWKWDGTVVYDKYLNAHRGTSISWGAVGSQFTDAQKIANITGGKSMLIKIPIDGGTVSDPIMKDFTAAVGEVFSLDIKSDDTDAANAVYHDNADCVSAPKTSIHSYAWNSEHNDVYASTYYAGACMLDGYTAVNSVSKVNASVYPNPASDYLKVKGNVNKVEIINLVGQKVKVIDNFRGESIDISDVKAGIYMVSLHTNNGVASQKVTIK